MDSDFSTVSSASGHSGTAQGLTVSNAGTAADVHGEGGRKPERWWLVQGAQVMREKGEALTRSQQTLNLMGQGLGKVL